jgi:hypothetical protein
MDGTPSSDGRTRRWPRGQKFTLTPAGLEADAQHRQVVSDVRGSGRPALETALSAWAGPHRVHPGDGLLLGELRRGGCGLNDLADALEGAGIERGEVKAGLDRLVAAGLVEPLERGPGTGTAP